MHFYPGLSPLQWLSDVPCAWVRACLQMVPRLAAEEALQRTSEVSVGTGSAGEQGKAISDHWLSVAQIGRTLPKLGPTAAAKLPPVGIGIELVEATR